MTLFAWLRPSSTRGRMVLLTPLLVCLLAGAGFWLRTGADASLAAPVVRGALTARLTTGGTLRPIQSITYRSPLAGREVEIVELVPEGTRVNEGDLLVRLDTTELQRDVERLQQEVRQSQMDLQIAEIEREEAEAAVQGVSEGEGALGVEEARTRLQIAEKKALRLREEYEQLEPLMDKGVITREELKKTGDALDQADEELALARKRTAVVVKVTHPRDSQRAALQLAQRNSSLENARTKAAEAVLRLKALAALVEDCSLYARRPGLVVYEEFWNANPRRKIRVGDRVTASHGIVTLPEVDRMIVEASVSEAEVNRVRPGQAAIVHVEAFPDLKLAGKVTRVGTLARSSIDRPFDEKRFDLIIELDGTPPELRPEMTARADIVIGTRSNVLIVPVNAVFERQGRFVAYVDGATGVETRTIELGASSDEAVEVVSGLREHERVLLTEPEGLSPDQGRASGNVLQPR